MSIFSFLSLLSSVPVGEYGGGWFAVEVVLTDGTSRPLVKGYGTFSLSATNVFMTPGDNTPILSLGGGEQQPQSEASSGQQQPGVDSELDGTPQDELQLSNGESSPLSAASGKFSLATAISMLAITTTMNIVFSVFR